MVCVREVEGVAVPPRRRARLRLAPDERPPRPLACTEPELFAQYLREVAAIPLLTPAAEAALLRRLADGDSGERREAREALITANLRLVVSVARQYRGVGLSLPELVAEGNLGLIAAVDRFDRARGVRFSTYARWPIRKAITGALDDRSRLVRLPANSWLDLRALRRAEETLPAALGRAPAPAEVAAACGVAPWRLAALRAAAAPPISLDAAPGGDALPDGADSPADLVGRRCARDDLAGLLSALPDRERRLLVLRFGLDGDRPRTLKQSGAAVGLSGEGARRLEARALARLRAHPAAIALRGGFD
ncbi:MAG TPA: RNA polymerase sigma factor RpoD/SigA [Thermomicrobiales bacterium]|nr:RNA polymerase sigma factor RpoD/SigA [Thermomicrobiales bacterium]